nr:hypothetical protein [Lachnospiraceae bacterium]
EEGELPELPEGVEAPSDMDETDMANNAQGFMNQNRRGGFAPSNNSSDTNVFTQIGNTITNAAQGIADWFGGMFS